MLRFVFRGKDDDLCSRGSRQSWNSVRRDLYLRDRPRVQLDEKHNCWSHDRISLNTFLAS